QSARGEAREVDDDALAQAGQVPRRVELADDDLPAEQREIAHQILEIDRWLDADLRRSDRVFRRKRMLAALEDLAAGGQSFVQVRAIGGAALARRAGRQF